MKEGEFDQFGNFNDGTCYSIGDIIKVNEKLNNEVEADRIYKIDDIDYDNEVNDNLYRLIDVETNEYFSWITGFDMLNYTESI